MQRKVFALFASKWLSLSINPCRIEIKSAEISLSSGHIIAINLDVSLFGSRVYAQMSFCTLRDAHSPICKIRSKFVTLDFINNVTLLLWGHNYNIVIAHYIFAAKGCSSKLYCTTSTQVVKALSFHLYHEVNQTVSVHIL